METKRNDYLVRKKFYRYLIPSFVSEVAMHAGYVIDAVIVGNLVGLDGLTVVTLANPVLQLLYIPGLILGLGGSTLAAVFLGERKIKEASDLLSACVIIGVLFSLAAGCVAFWISEPLSYILSADHPQLSPLLEDYLFVNILGLPVMSLSLLTCEFMSVDNNPDLGAYMFGIASVMDVVLDVVFIKFAGLGMTGAALGTIVGYACGLITLVYYARAKNRMLQMYWRGVAWMKNLLDALKTGTPRISLEVMQALQIFILNSAVLRILGPDAMEIYAICTSTLIMAELLAGGIISVIPNICGVLFGERDYFAIRKLMRKVVLLSGVPISLLTLFFLLLPGEIAIFFGMEADSPHMPIAEVCLQIYSLSFVFYVFNEFLQVYYQTILETMLATLDTILEFFALLIPITFLLMDSFGLYGVCAAVPVSELLTILIVEAVRKLQQQRGKLPREGLLMIPRPEHDDSLDATIAVGEDNAVGISKKIFEYAINRKADERTAQVLRLATEEMAVNISRYGYGRKENSFIDVNLSRDGETWLLRIRDDGIPFDPTKYKPEEECDYLIGGIALIRQMAKKITYTRVLNMNNTVIEV